MGLPEWKDEDSDAGRRPLPSICRCLPPCWISLPTTKAHHLHMCHITSTNTRTHACRQQSCLSLLRPLPALTPAPCLPLPQAEFEEGESGGGGSSHCGASSQDPSSWSRSLTFSPSGDRQRSATPPGGGSGGGSQPAAAAGGRCACACVYTAAGRGCRLAGRQSFELCPAALPLVACRAAASLAALCGGAFVEHADASLAGVARASPPHPVLQAHQGQPVAVWEPLRAEGLCPGTGG